VGKQAGAGGLTSMQDCLPGWQQGSRGAGLQQGLAAMQQAHPEAPLLDPSPRQGWGA
jgi:hypothetical protein